MASAKHKAQDDLTLLEVALQLHGEFRRRLDPIRVTPLQAGVILYLERHVDANMTNVAAALRIQPPTLVIVIQDLVRKRWVNKRPSIHDGRAVCLRLSRQGQGIARKVKIQVQQVRNTFDQLKEVT